MKTVMVVDDEGDVRETVRAVLEKEGYAVVTAISGDDALKKVRGGTKPNLVLLDIMMPGTPVKKIVPKLGAKVVYLSVVRLSDLEKKELMGNNVKGFVQKPFDIKHLVSEVKRHLG